MSFIVEKEWITAVGLRACAIICKRGPKDERLGYRCGYVAVPVGHSFHGVAYNTQLSEIAQEAVDNAQVGMKSPITVLTYAVGSDDPHNKVRRSLDIAIECHGGLTYSAGGNDYPLKGDEWWFGFDCAHAGDEDIEPDPQWPRAGVTRNLAYVVQNCEAVAWQITQLAKAPT